MKTEAFVQRFGGALTPPDSCGGYECCTPYFLDCIKIRFSSSKEILSSDSGRYIVPGQCCNKEISK